MKTTCCLVIFLLLPALTGCVETNLPVPTISPSPFPAKITQTMSPSSTSAAAQNFQKPTQTPFERTATSTETLPAATATHPPIPSPVPTSTPESGPWETVYIFNSKVVKNIWVNDIIVVSPAEFWVFQSGEIDYFKDGLLESKVSIKEITEKCLAFEITKKRTIWLFDVGDWPRLTAKVRLIEIDLLGNVLTEYVLPKSILVDADGKYIEHGLDDLWWNKNDELILGGTDGFYQLLNAQGGLDVQKHRGYESDSHIIKMTKFLGSPLEPAEVTVDNLLVPITTTYDEIALVNRKNWGFVGFQEDGDFFLQVREYSSKNNFSRVSLRQYSVSGNLIARITLLQGKDLYNTDYPLTTMGHDGHLYAFIPSGLSKNSLLVRLEIGK